MMKTIRVNECGEPEVLKVEDAALPMPAAGQVVVRVLSAGVNPVETYFRAGKFGYTRSLPFTPGNDGAGEVAAVGEGVTNLKVGQRVFTCGSLSGTYAQFALCSATTVFPLPENISFDQGAAISVPYRTAYRALFQKLHCRAGQSVLIHGASGGVGIACVQMAVAQGLTVIASAGTDEGMALVKRLGAHFVVNHRTEGYLGQVLAFTQDRGVDVIVEMAAHVNLGKDLAVLALGGTVAVIGSRSPVEITPRELMARDASIVGIKLYGTTEEISEAVAYITQGLRQGTLTPIVGAAYPLIRAPDAHRDVIAHDKGSGGKIVLHPWDS